jgi:hypothetical protein
MVDIRGNGTLKRRYPRQECGAGLAGIVADLGERLRSGRDSLLTIPIIPRKRVDRLDVPTPGDATGTITGRLDAAESTVDRQAGYSPL